MTSGSYMRDFVFSVTMWGCGICECSQNKTKNFKKVLESIHKLAKQDHTCQPSHFQQETPAQLPGKIREISRFWIL